MGARYAVDAADSFRLGETLRLVAFPGDHTEFEAPPLASGRRVRGPGDVEVGLGLADALGLRPGSTLAAQLPSGEEVRFRVSGVVRALENDGRIAWVRSDRLLAASPRLGASLAVRLEPGADRAAVDPRADRPRRAAAVRLGGDDPQRRSSSPCWPGCCAGSASRSASCACTRWCRRWP